MTVRIGIVGNCQAKGFSDSVKAMTGADIETIYAQDILNSTDAEHDTWLERLRSCDHIFSQPQNDVYKRLSAEMLKQLGPPVTIYPYIVFTGLHPDCHYFSMDGQLVPAPAVYHSAIIGAAYMEGLSERRAERLFNAYTYASLGYFDAFNNSVAALGSNFHRYGYDLETFLAKDRSFMHTINHPRIGIIFDIARQALNLAGIDGSGEASVPPDDLGRASIWPVYPELADRQGLKGGFTFQLSAGNCLDLLEYIVQSYQHYCRFGKELSSRNIERARKFIAKDVIK